MNSPGPLTGQPTLPERTRGSRRPTEALLPVAVLGGGITGLSAAWQLRRQGVPVVVFESRGQPGGVAGSIREDGWLHETGPNTLFENSPAITALLDDLGLRGRCLEASPAAARRYVVRGGRPVALPDSPLNFLPNRLLSWSAKFAALGEPFRPRRKDDHEENVAEFVTRRLGAEFLDYVVNPFVAGVYAGDPAGLSVRHAFPKLYALEREHGSLIRGSLRRRNGTAGPRGRMVSFPEGLAEIPRALAAGLDDGLRLNRAVAFIRRTGTIWRIGFVTPDGLAEENFSSVICALPPDALAGLSLTMEGVPGSEGLAALQEIRQPPVASVFMGFRRADVAHALDGFGLLTPAVEKRRILGTLFSSTLFPGRAPAGHVALTTFVGGMRQPELALQNDEDLVETVQGELTALLGVRQPPVFTRIHRWPRAIAQYGVGFQRFKDACTAVEASSPGLLLGGTCRDGVSLANCITAGQRLAAAAQARIDTLLNQVVA